MTVLLLYLTAIGGALSTFYLAQHRYFNPVRASSLLTIVFFSALYGITLDVELWAAAFFGGSFIGMSAPHRVSVLLLTLATAVFMVFFIWLLPVLKGVGGVLGLSAFLSVVLARVVALIIMKLKPKSAP